MRTLRWIALASFRFAVGLGAAVPALSSPAWGETCKLPEALAGVLQPAVEAVTRAPPAPGLLPPSLDPTAIQPLARAIQPLPTIVDRIDLDRTLTTLCSALEGLGLSSGLTVLSVTGFTGAIMSRLASVRRSGDASPTSGGGGAEGMMMLGAMKKAQPAPQPGVLGPFTVYVSGTFLGGSSSDMPGAAGFTYGASSGMIGLEYSASRYLILGIAASFTQMESDAITKAATDADIVHGALYMSYSTRQWFVDALAAYGSVTLDMTRPGAVETVHGSTDATAAGVAARAGYLFDLGKIRLGPIAGLSYVRAKVAGYTESGGDPTAMQVDGQTIESLAGSAGIRFLAPFQVNGTLLVPYLNITLEHQFGGSTGSVTTSLAQAPGAPVALSFPIFGARDYGKVEGGLTIELSPEASISLSGASTFARNDGHDYRVSAGLSWRF